MSLWKNANELAQLNLPKIVAVGLVSEGLILTGQRRDNQKWTSPGGHMDDGETILQAARREVLEESGITIENRHLELVHAEKTISHRTGKEFVVFAFVANIEKTLASAKNDPDKEISEWRWVPMSMSSPELQPEMRHAKVDHVLRHLGLWPTEAHMARLKRGSKIVDRINNYEIWVTENEDMLRWSNGSFQGGVKALKANQWNYLSGFIFTDEQSAAEDARRVARQMKPAVKLAADKPEDKDKDKKKEEDRHPESKGRSMKEITDSIRSAGQKPVEEDQPSYPDPKKKTPAEMKQDPEELLADDEVTGEKDKPEGDDQVKKP